MHVTDCGPIAVLFEVTFGPLGPHRTVLHYEEYDRIFHGPLRPLDMRERNADQAYKRRGTVASGNIVMCRFQSDQLPESALTVRQRLWHSDENPSDAVGGAYLEIPG